MAKIHKNNVLNVTFESHKAQDGAIDWQRWCLVALVRSSHCSSSKRKPRAAHIPVESDKMSRYFLFHRVCLGRCLQLEHSHRAATIYRSEICSWVQCKIFRDRDTEICLSNLSWKQRKDIMRKLIFFFLVLVLCLSGTLQNKGKWCL